MHITTTHSHCVKEKNMLAYVLEVKVVDSVQLAPLALDYMYYIHV